MTQRTYIQLGRAGDIIGILPLLYLEAQSGKRSALMVAKEYASILEGVSYVDPIIFDGEAHEIDKAVAQAKTLSADVKCLQVCGPADLVREYTFRPAGKRSMTKQSFLQEAWDLAGHYDKWKDQPPLVFDRRDKEREAELLKLLPKKKKVILYSTKGVSSPFKYHELLRQLLQGEFGRTFTLFDLGTVRAHRIYDLLGLFEAAHCLVTTDSAPLHLAYGCRIPVVALVNDQSPATEGTPDLEPMKGSPWRPNHIAHIRYNDFPMRAVEMLSAIRRIDKPGSWFRSDGAKAVHVWSQYEMTDASAERHLEAVKTWEAAYEKGDWIACPVEYGALGMDSKLSTLADDKRFPFVKDVIGMACMRAKDNHWIYLTRHDTCLAPYQAPSGDFPIYCHRAIRENGIDTYHPAVDLFCFTKKWWMDHKAAYPNMIMGMDYQWHRVLMELIKKYGGKEIKGACYRAPSPWVIPPKQDKPPPRIAYNANLYEKWMKAENIGGMVPPVDRQVELLPIARRSLHPFGYNPSLIKWKDRLLMAYRWHQDGRHGTVLAMAELSPDGKVRANKSITLDVGQRSLEDPRLFIVNDELWVCFVDAVWPDMNPKCVTRWGKLVETEMDWKIIDTVQPICGKNDGTALEKNFVFWSASQSTKSFLYQTQPKQIIYSFQGDKLTMGQECEGPRWSWGSIKGGTSPIPFGDKLLRFFHSTLDNESGSGSRRRYYIGACLCETEIPHAVVAISKEPIIRGSETDDLTETERSSCHHHKNMVVFPAGCIKVEDSFWLSLGVNDASCVIAKIKESDLKL